MGGGGTTIQAPAAPQYNESMRSILQAQIDLAPQVYASEQKYQPLYNQLQVQQQTAAAQAAMDQAKSLYPQVAQVENQYNAANRAGELQQLQTTLPQYQQAFNALTPGYAEGINATGKLAQQAMGNALNQPQLSAYEQGVRGPQMRSNLGNINQGIVNQYVGTMPGMGEYANFLANASRSELEQGKNLTPEEQRMADQSARSAYAARGTALGPQSVGAEILNRADVSSQRYQQRLANAQNAAATIQGIYTPALQQAYQRQSDMQNFGVQQQQVAFNQALQRNQAEQQRLMGAQQIQSGYAQLGAGALGQLQQSQAPILQAFYKQPILQGQVGAAQNMGMAMQQQAGPSLFNPESATGMGSIYGAYNAQMGLAGAQAQANAGKSAGIMGMLGSLGGAALGAGAKMYVGCWIAREVYGEQNPEWLLFRDWVEHDAPGLFAELYCQFGERIAKFISNKPTIKAVIKKWMDSKIGL
jgi:hypothetical protein